MAKPNITNKRLWISVGAIFGIAALLASFDHSQNWLQDWCVYSLLLLLCVGSLYWANKIIPGDKTSMRIAWVAFAIRLVVGVGLAALLPILGYAGSLEHQAGYVFHDAYMRDQQAWELASSSNPLSSAFADRYPGDQYGGLLALSGLLYRYLSPDAHRPYLILILTATAAGWGVLLLYQAAKTWFGDRLAGLAAWIFALFPESVLLGSSQMREMFVMTAVAMTFYSLTQMHRRRIIWLSWLGVAGVILIAIQPPAAFIAFITLFGVWLFEPHQQRSWKPLAFFISIVLVAAVLVFLAWANLPSLENIGPLQTFIAWLQNNFLFQSYLTERASGMFQSLISSIGERWTWLVVLIYGIAQPVLPAVVGDPDAVVIMRVIGFFRAIGWYALIPFLVYGVTSALRASPDERRSQMRWLSLVIWSWVILAALNAGGDQWDNPRYRTVLLAWQALFAAWAWMWARKHADPWLKRWLIVECIFVLVFTEWYLARYYPNFPHLNIWVMILLTLTLGVLTLAGGWLLDRRKTGAKNRTHMQE